MGGGCCNISKSGTSAFFLSFLILARATTATTVTATSAHTSTTPPTPTDTTMIRVFGSSVAGASVARKVDVGCCSVNEVGPRLEVWLLLGVVAPKFWVGCCSVNEVGPRLGVWLGLGVELGFREGLWLGVGLWLGSGAAETKCRRITRYEVTAEIFVLNSSCMMSVVVYSAFQLHKGRKKSCSKVKGIRYVV